MGDDRNTFLGGKARGFVSSPARARNRSSTPTAPFITATHLNYTNIGFTSLATGIGGLPAGPGLGAEFLVLPDNAGFYLNPPSPFGNDPMGANPGDLIPSILPPQSPRIVPVSGTWKVRVPCDADGYNGWTNWPDHSLIRDSAWFRGGASGQIIFPDVIIPHTFSCVTSNNSLAAFTSKWTGGSIAVYVTGAAGDTLLVTYSVGSGHWTPGNAVQGFSSTITRTDSTSVKLVYTGITGNFSSLNWEYDSGSAGSGYFPIDSGTGVPPYAYDWSSLGDNPDWVYRPGTYPWNFDNTAVGTSMKFLSGSGPTVMFDIAIG